MDYNHNLIVNFFANMGEAHVIDETDEESTSLIHRQIVGQSWRETKAH